MTETAEGHKLVCNTCGCPTTDAGHLCEPQELPKEQACCAYCGTTIADERHACPQKVAALQYVCEECGRLATSRALLCKPKRVAG